MVYFIASVVALIIGYFTYGAFVEKVFGMDLDRKTPALTQADGVDYISMPTWKVFVIQLLGIAGLGPIVGPILAALYGPQALLWIVLGSIFAGGVHDFLSGMLSVRNGGVNIPGIVGHYMGRKARWGVRVLSVVLLLLVGVVFIVGPAALIHELIGGNYNWIVVCIFGYYFLSTVLPVDKVIGRLFPIFGGLLLFTSIAIIAGLVISGRELIPNTDFFTNTHPTSLPIWPLMFVTLSCGAISGFHATQSPLMARCIKHERRGRMVFYGAMILEGIIALVWATLGLSFYDSPETLNEVLAVKKYSGFVHLAAEELIGSWGALLAIVGVVILPITSGDTAFRSTRLILSEGFKVKQDKPLKRLAIAVPLFVLAAIIMQTEWQKIWRYFGLSNQALATVVLWAGAVYLGKHGKFHWIATLPATFMTAVIASWVAYSEPPLGFGTSQATCMVIGWIVAALVLFAYMVKLRKWNARLAAEAAAAA